MSDISSQQPDRSKEIFAKLQKEYSDTIPAKLDKLQQLINDLRKDMREDTFKELRLQVHKFAGSSGTYGFADLSHNCKTFEEYLIKRMDELKKGKQNSAWLNEFDQHLDKIKNCSTNGR